MNNTPLDQYIREHRKDIIKLLFLKEKERRKKLSQLFFYFRHLDKKDLLRSENFSFPKLILFLNMNEMFLNYSRQINLFILRSIKSYDASCV